MQRYDNESKRIPRQWCVRRDCRNLGLVLVYSGLGCRNDPGGPPTHVSQIPGRWHVLYLWVDKKKKKRLTLSACTLFFAHRYNTVFVCKTQTCSN